MTNKNYRTAKPNTWVNALLDGEVNHEGLAAVARDQGWKYSDYPVPGWYRPSQEARDGVEVWVNSGSAPDTGAWYSRKGLTTVGVTTSPPGVPFEAYLLALTLDGHEVFCPINDPEHQSPVPARPPAPPAPTQRAWDLVVEGVWEDGFVNGVPSSWCEYRRTENDAPLLAYVDYPGDEADLCHWTVAAADQGIRTLIASTPGKDYARGSMIDKVRTKVILALYSEEAPALDPYEADIIRQYEVYGEVVFG